MDFSRHVNKRHHLLAKCVNNILSVILYGSNNGHVFEVLGRTGSCGDGHEGMIYISCLHMVEGCSLNVAWSI